MTDRAHSEGAERAHRSRMDTLKLTIGSTILSKDYRPIKTIAWDQEDEPNYSVGTLGVTEIVAYDEHGQMSYVPWLAVIMGDVICVRVPADQVMVVYWRPGEQEGTEGF